MSQSCQRCNKTYNGPEAFLLTCRACRKTWHHRCLMPPMEDQALIQLIRAKNAGDTANDLSSWTCRRCKKRGTETPSAASSREQTASSEDSKSWSSSRCPPVRDTTVTSITSVASTVARDVRVKQELHTAVDPPLVNDRERSQKSNRPQSTETAPMKHFSAKRPKSSVANQTHVQPPPGPSQAKDMDVQMADVTSVRLPPQRPSPPTQSYLAMAARKFGSTVPAISSEDDAEMQVDSPSFSDSAASAISEARPTTIQPQVNQVAANEIDDDPEDLYGPPVEHRIIRILPALAEELREQRWRVAAEKETRRAPLAPDWILAKHVNDPLWKNIPATKGQKRGKPTARKLGENGLDVNELMSSFTVQNWVREHKE